jgi:hypothetical protein
MRGKTRGQGKKEGEAGAGVVRGMTERRGEGEGMIVIVMSDRGAEKDGRIGGQIEIEAMGETGHSRETGRTATRGCKIKLMSKTSPIAGPKSPSPILSGYLVQGSQPPWLVWVFPKSREQTRDHLLPRLGREWRLSSRQKPDELISIFFLLVCRRNLAESYEVEV